MNAIILASVMSDYILSIAWCDLVPLLWQRAPFPLLSLMEVIVGHQNLPLWPLQSVPRPSTISMEIVGLQK